MANFVVVHKASNLCVSVISTSLPPKPNAKYSFFRINDKALTYYYRYKDKNTLLDIGHLCAVSPYVYDQVTQGKSGKVSPLKHNV